MSKDSLEASKLRLLLKQLPASVWTTDRNLRFTSFAGLSPLPNVDAETLLGTSLFDYFTTSDENFAPIRAHKEAVEGRAGRFELFWVNHTFQVSVEPFRDDRGEIVGVIGIALNVSERRRMEATRDTLSMAVEQAAESIIITKPDGTIIYVNPSFEKVTGYTREEVLGKNPRMLQSGEHSPEFYKELWRTLTAGHAWSGRFINKRKDGTLWEENTVISPVLDKNGNLIHYVAVKRDVTRERAAEEALSEYAAIVESSSDAIFGKTLEGGITSWNRGAETLYGYTSAEILGQSGAWLFPPDRMSEERDIIRQIKEGRSVKSYETVRRRKDGSLVDVSVAISPIVDSSGTVTGASNVARDITERKRAEAESSKLTKRIELQQAHLKDILATVPGVVWEAHGRPDAPSQRIEFVSDYVEQMIGYSTEEWLSTPNFWLSIVHPDDKDRVASEAASLFAAGQGGPLTFRWIARDGRIVWVESQTVVIADADSRPVGVRGVTIDITDRKQAEQKMLEAERRAVEAAKFGQTIIEAATLGIATYDAASGECLSCNEAMAAAVGGTLEAILKQDFRQIESWRIHGILANAEAALATGKSVRDEAHIVTGFGKKLWLDYSLIPFSFKSKPSLLLIFSDNTQRKALEAQFLQAQKMEAVGQLAGGIAHDFNNMVTVVNGYADLLMRELQDGNPMRSKLEEIKKAGTRSAALARQLLTFSRKHVAQPTVLNLNSVIGDVEKWLRRIIGEHIDLKTMLEPVLGNVRVDPSHIEQIITNLAINARDAMPEGGKLTIETRNIELREEYTRSHIGATPGSYAMLAVSDTGIGMDEATQSRIFEPFFTTKEAGKGTGLGLSTVFGIVQQCGGLIQVYSEIGNGTVFKVYFPAVDDQTPETKSSAARLEIARGTETILIVEDDTAVRELAAQMLGAQGYRVLTAANAAEAAAITERHHKPIHLLLADIILPGESGVEAAGRLALSRPGMKVLFMSGYTDNAMIHRGVLEKNLQFIQKPFDLAGLVSKVRETLG